MPQVIVKLWPGKTEKQKDGTRKTIAQDVAYELMLYGRKPPYKLHITIGDPDSGDAIQFEKRQ